MVTGATPGATVPLYASDQLGVKAVPGCAGLALDLASPFLLAEAVADADGVATVVVSVPGAFAGRTSYAQALEVGSCLRTEPRSRPGACV